MKKLVLLIAVTLGITTAKAQSFSIPQDTVFMFTSGSAELHTTVNNLTNSPLTVNWRMLSHSFDANWSSGGICDNITCYDWSNVSGGSSQTTDAIAANTNMDLKVILDGTTAANGSRAWVTLRVTDPATMLNKTVTYVAMKAPTSVNNVSKNEDNLTLYPNPAINNVNVVFDASLNVKNIAIYNLIGKAVKVYKVNGNSAKLEINDVPSGIYFVRLINAQGQIVATRKFTHQ